MIWFELILGGVIGLLTGYYAFTVVEVVGSFIENMIKLLLRFARLRVGNFFKIVIRIILVNLIGYTFVYLPFILITPLTNDRYFFYGGWLSLMIGLVAYTFKQQSKERR